MLIHLDTVNSLELSITKLKFVFKFNYIKIFLFELGKNTPNKHLKFIESEQVPEKY